MQDIDRIRHFNRFYTAHMGLYSADFLGAGLSVMALRVFYEIAIGDGRSARSIAQELGLDEGYVSRLVKGFEGRGWLERVASEQDARRKEIRLTKDGQGAFNTFVAKSRTETERRLNGANPRVVAAALTQAEAALIPVDPATVVLRDMLPGDAGWLIERNAETYVSEYGHTIDIEHVVGAVVLNYMQHRDPATHRAYIAADPLRRLGSVFLEPGEASGVCKLRVFFVDPSARGLGLGRRLIEACIAGARDIGYTRMELMTIDTLKPAPIRGDPGRP